MALNKKKRLTKMSNNKTYPSLTFDEALNLTVSAKMAEGIRERTLKDYRKDWGYFIKWLNQNYPQLKTVDELTTQILRDYINYCKYDAVKYEGHKYIQKQDEIGLSDTTINIRLRVYKAIFNHLEREDLIQVNPLSNVKLLKQDIDLTNNFTDDEIKELFKQPNLRDYVGFRDYVCMTILLDCGLRAGELLSLRISDIDFKTRFITVHGHVAKNRHVRLVPFSTHTLKLLLQLIEENRKHFSTDRIFLSQWGEPLGQNHFNKRLKFYADKAGITDKKVTAHVYRHTWAKNMVLNGADAFTLQKIGGWSDIRTMRRYIQMDTNDMRIAHDNYSPANSLLNKRGLRK
ncbi:integrase/recombinase XerD [Ureibacillus xyleni]|uniref:Integrase/recombinase XerD n=1 Tax=Ureibacillus xyleni TaxID=614648 RepID=A0A285SX84_9BACL|nr:tyrosine-type recombinase/integrase [Ureibacillus xyleni]SOC12971.1 integrase/recombinase XerD [Ureibacillus xyleni]